MRMILLLVTLLATSTALAWNNSFSNPYNSGTRIQEQQLGNFGFGSGTIGGQPYSSTRHRLGSFEFESGRIGSHSYNCTTHTMGSFVNTTCR